jgi:hypothetical protein
MEEGRSETAFDLGPLQYGDRIQKLTNFIMVFFFLQNVKYPGSHLNGQSFPCSRHKGIETV